MTEQNAPPTDRVRNLIEDIERTKPGFLENANTDKVISVLMRLAMEISVLRDRVSAQEAILKKNNLIEEGAIDRYEPDADEAKIRAEQKRRLIASIVHDLS